jgi:MFS family permease
LKQTYHSSTSASRKPRSGILTSSLTSCQASWLGTGYLLGLTAMTPLYGRLAQVMGRKGAMLLALTLFFSNLPAGLS